jgi:hypothetical protein
VRFAERLQTGADRGAIVATEQSLRAQHTCMSDRRAHVVYEQALVQAVVLAGREPQNAFIER